MLAYLLAFSYDVIGYHTRAACYFVSEGSQDDSKGHHLRDEIPGAGGELRESEYLKMIMSIDKGRKRLKLVTVFPRT